MCREKLLFGLLNINKPIGMTSHDVVSALRKVSKIKQIGHAGTLDPFADGVLPVAIGKATRIIEYLSDNKEYLATVQFGANTDTYDLDGEITQTFNIKVTKDQVEKSLTNFEGEISQIPPMYSAIKVNGKKLYDYAREGKDIEIKPRNVTVYKIELDDFDYEKQTAKILVECSKGTYIRSIAYDLGKMLGCGGYLTKLTRTKAGKFSAENSIPLENIKTFNDIEKNIINPTEVIDIPQKELSEKEQEMVLHGMAIENFGYKNSDIVFLVYSGKIYAIGMVLDNKILVKKVFEVL